MQNHMECNDSIVAVGTEHYLSSSFLDAPGPAVDHDGLLLDSVPQLLPDEPAVVVTIMDDTPSSTNKKAPTSPPLDDADRMVYHEDFPALLKLAAKVKSRREALNPHLLHHHHNSSPSHMDPNQVISAVSRIQQQFQASSKNKKQPTIIRKGIYPMTDSMLDESFQILQQELERCDLYLKQQQQEPPKTPPVSKTSAIAPSSSTKRRKKTTDAPIAVKYSKWQTDILMDWMIQHKDHPFPDATQIQELCHVTGLSHSQVVNWTTNVRKRNLKATVENGKKPHHFLDFLFLASDREQREAAAAANGGSIPFGTPSSCSNVTMTPTKTTSRSNIATTPTASTPPYTAALRRTTELPDAPPLSSSSSVASPYAAAAGMASSAPSPMAAFPHYPMAYYPHPHHAAMHMPYSPYFPPHHPHMYNPYASTPPASDSSPHPSDESHSTNHSNHQSEEQNDNETDQNDGDDDEDDWEVKLRVVSESFDEDALPDPARADEMIHQETLESFAEYWKEHCSSNTNLKDVKEHLDDFVVDLVNSEDHDDVLLDDDGDDLMADMSCGGNKRKRDPLAMDLSEFAGTTSVMDSDEDMHELIQEFMEV